MIPSKRGTLARCTSPTPGLHLNRLYEIVAVIDDPILRKLLQVKPLEGPRAGDIIPHAYYPWRFTLVRDE